MKNILLALMTAAVMMFSSCSSKEAPPGYTGPAEVSTYFVTPLMSTDDVTLKLESAGQVNALSYISHFCSDELNTIVV